MTSKDPLIIALYGKGGVGKTCLSVLLTRMFCEDLSRRVLDIDADPAVGLSYPLGVEVTRTVDKIRRDLILRLKQGKARDMGISQKTGVIANRIRTREEELDVRSGHTLPWIGALYDDETLCTFGRKGQSFFTLPPTTILEDLAAIMERFFPRAFK